MICKQVQQEILDSLAAGNAALQVELLAHQQSCQDCRKYYETQSALFRSMEQGLGLMANSPVPPSLLPVVRTRLCQQSTARSTWLYSWPLAGLVASALVAVAFVLFWHRPQRTPATPEAAPTVAPQQNSTEQRGTAPITSEVLKVTPMRPPHVVKPRNRSTASGTAEEPSPEVIVLNEEREAFSRFIARVPESPAAALALSRPLLGGTETAVAIALLKIDTLEVKPLESNE
jgi:hypothetical protein